MATAVGHRATRAPGKPSIESVLFANAAEENPKVAFQLDGEGDVRLPRWLLARLCAAALAAGIALDGAEELVRTLGAPLASSRTTLRSLPRIRIYTLGRFSLVKGDEPVTFPGKAPHKPIELLQALIALGGRDIHTELLMGAVWPDDDSADLRSLFDNTLHRLRRILDCADAIKVNDGRLTLNPEHCWVDAWDFDRLSRQHAAAPAPEAAVQALHLYQGHFLQRDAPRAWLFAYRERLRRRFQRMVLIEGARLELAQRPQDAVACYERGLELDPMAEALYQRLMMSHARRGETADVVCVYRRCREQLVGELGVEPAAATRAVLQAALAAAAHSPS